MECCSSEQWKHSDAFEISRLLSILIDKGLFYFCVYKIEYFLWWSLSNFMGWILFTPFIFEERRGMDFDHVLGLVAGLSLFLLGMNSMGMV